ncbi:MAG: GDP-mannose 4,6-dehydratase [Candidatus Stahlbacteria bacterium]|nr:GDP-mannose 4,6-dehydratase [Candidatus Stahlbacteria bacterium]
MMQILITGVAGFIGANVAEKLLQLDNSIIGIDNLNDYYDVRLKEWRLSQLYKYTNFKFYKLDIEDYKAMLPIFKSHNFDALINEAARAGVGYSIQNPYIYIKTNVYGTLNLLELCKAHLIKKIIIPSTSALYAGQPMPFKEWLPVNTPISPYAASKKAAEALAYTYHHLYNIDVSILRYFSVYGPAGRPDMSILRFIKWTMENKPIVVFGDGNQSRDFTFIEDIVDGTINALRPLGYEIINLGHHTPYTLNYAIQIIEQYLNQKIHIIYKEFSKADIKETLADITKAKKLLNWEPKTSLEQGIVKLIQWMQQNWNWFKDIKL